MESRSKRNDSNNLMFNKEWNSVCKKGLKEFEYYRKASLFKKVSLISARFAPSAVFQLVHPLTVFLSLPAS